MSKRVIILIGPPGSGKGTQAELLAKELDLFYFETSKVIESKVMSAKEGDEIVIDGQKYSLAEEKRLFNEGRLNTPVIVAFWVKQEIEKTVCQDKGLILSGSPRTFYEGKEIIPFLKKLYGPENIQVVLVRLNPGQSIWRNARRRICSECRHPVPYTRETQRLIQCPQCGGQLVTRGDLDKEETIKVRLKEYEERTKPLLEYFEEEGLAIKKIEGEQSIEKVYQDILKVIKD